MSPALQSRFLTIGIPGKSHTLHIYPFVDRLLFPILAIINRAEMNMGVQISFL